jgi:hypothetical protein
MTAHKTAHKTGHKNPQAQVMAVRRRRALAGCSWRFGPSAPVRPRGDATETAAGGLREAYVWWRGHGGSGRACVLLGARTGSARCR